MSTISVDWTVAVFLLMALVMVRSLRHQIRADSIESYDNIAGGLTILAVVTLAKVYNNLEMFSSVPFLSESVFFDLVCWISIITGGTVLISGVAQWLPLARYHRQYNKTRIEHLDLVRRVEQLVAVENRPDSILSATLEHIVRQMSFEQGVVLKGSARTGQMQVVSHFGAAGVDSSPLAQVRLRPEYLSLVRAGQRPKPQIALENLSDHLTSPDNIYPLRIGGQVVGFFVLWQSSAMEYTADDDLILRLSADVVARKINAERTALQLAAVESRATWAESLVAKAAGRAANRERFSAVVHGLSPRLSFESASLSLYALNKSVMDKYSIGAGGQVLVENRTGLPPAASPLATCFESGEDIVIDQVNSDRPDLLGNIVSGTTVRSLAAVTVTFKNAYRAVLVVGSATPGAIGWRHLADLKALRPLLVEMLAGEKEQDRQKRQVARVGALEHLSAVVVEAGLSSRTFEAAARIISDELAADIVRISTLDETGGFLGSRVVISTQPVSGMVPANGQSILSLMLRHRQALIEGRSIKINSRSGKQMSEIEISQAFVPGVKSASIYPVMVKGQPVAVISAADMSFVADGNDSATDAFISAVSNILATAFDHPLASQRAAVPVASSPEARLGDAQDRRAQLRSSLTGILGSVELLRGRPTTTDDKDADRYLAIIDRSARRISETIAQEESVR